MNRVHYSALGGIFLKDQLQRSEGKWDKMQHDLPTKINLKSLTDLADKGNPAVLLFWDFSEAPAFVL